jgi:peptidoglycan DL-endopeptidase LytE
MGSLTVRPGDTAYSLARAAGVSLESLLAANGLNQPTLRVGQTLKVPGTGLVQSVAPPALQLAAQTGGQTRPTRSGLPTSEALKLGRPARLPSLTPVQTVPLPAVPGQGELPPPLLAPQLAPFVPGPLAGDPTPGEATTPAGWRETALALLGTPYVYGGTTPRGLDCSGLILQVFASEHLPLPRTSAAQAQVGQAVERGQWQPGDLLFFDTEGQGRVTHVGLYLGDGAFIHANSYEGEVTISALSEKYYASRYLWARRVLGPLAGP